MARAIEAYRDDRGNLHNSPTSAIVADIAAALGRVGDEGGLTAGVAKLILDRRVEIEKAFADLDALGESAPKGQVVDHPMRRAH
jgi:hypothetical protein